MHGDRARRIADPWRCADAPCCPFFARGGPASASRKPPDHTGSASGGHTRPRRVTDSTAALGFLQVVGAPPSPAILPESPVDPPGNLSYRVPERPLDVIALLSDSTRSGTREGVSTAASRRTEISTHFSPRGSASQCCAQPCDDITPARGRRRRRCSPLTSEVGLLDQQSRSSGSWRADRRGAGTFTDRPFRHVQRSLSRGGMHRRLVIREQRSVDRLGRVRSGGRTLCRRRARSALTRMWIEAAVVSSGTAMVHRQSMAFRSLHDALPPAVTPAARTGHRL